MTDGTDDMAIEPRSYPDPTTAQLGERVTNLGRRQTDLENEMRNGFKQMESAMSTLAHEMRGSIATITSSLAERNKPQWQALGVALTFAAMLGGLAYLPIREATTDLKNAVSTIADRMVTRQEMDWRQARGAEDRVRLEAMVKELRDQQVPRDELDRVWQSYDQRFSDQQRQLDDLKQAQGSVYGARDVILDLRERLDRIERQRIAAGISGQ